VQRDQINTKTTGCNPKPTKSSNIPITIEIWCRGKTDGLGIAADVLTICKNVHSVENNQGKIHYGRRLIGIAMYWQKWCDPGLPIISNRLTNLAGNDYLLHVTSRGW